MSRLRRRVAPLGTSPLGSRRALGWLSAAPVTLPTLAAVGVFAYWETDGAGYEVTVWAPGALLILGLLAVSSWALPLRVRELPRALRVALVALAGFTAWSYVSILWADDQGIAWDGANRTLLYLVAFGLFALWRQPASGAATVLGAWTLATIGIAIAVLVGLDVSQFSGDRLVQPAGYVNAAAATWMLAAWPALALATAREVPWALRGVFAGGAVVLCDLALLSQSRGSVIATGIVLALSFLLLPDRVRRMVTLLPIAIGLAVTVPTVLHAVDGEPVGDLGAVIRAALGAAVAVAVVVGAGAALDARRIVAVALEARIHRALGAVGLLAVVAGIAVGLAAMGDPGERISSAWSSFKGGYDVTPAESRLASGLGSNRYDFYRVGLDLFAEHPLVGVGADNFQQDYLARGRSTETPRYPHSIEIRTLQQTGVIGTLLLLAALGGALLAALPAVRHRDPLVRAVAAGALGTFAYWLVHGSADWFFEIAGLGAPAFAALGLACSPARRQHEAAAPAPRRSRRRLAVALVAELALLAGLVSLAAPWLAARNVDAAASSWRDDPQHAFDRLDHAASLNPLSDQPQMIGAVIALRLDDLRTADAEYAAALRRNPRDAYAELQRGAIASMLGHRSAALRHLERARRMNPRDDLTARALQIVRSGKRVDVQALNQVVLARAQQLGG